jgi:hypothetical protein
LVRPAMRSRHIQVLHAVRRTPVVNQNYCPCSRFSGLVFTLNDIAVTEDSAITCVHDSDHEQHH